MNEINHLKQLTAAARAEPLPSLDVTQAVLRSIAARQSQRTDNGVLWVMAAAAVLAAMLSLGLAWQDWSGVSDPLQGLFGQFAMVMQ